MPFWDSGQRHDVGQFVVCISLWGYDANDFELEGSEARHSEGCILGTVLDLNSEGVLHICDDVLLHVNMVLPVCILAGILSVAVGWRRTITTVFM